MKKLRIIIIFLYYNKIGIMFQKINKNILTIILMIFFITLLFKIYMNYYEKKKINENYINQLFIEGFKSGKSSKSKKNEKKSTTTSTSSSSSTSSTSKKSEKKNKKNEKKTNNNNTTGLAATAAPVKPTSSLENYNETCDIKLDEWNMTPEQIKAQKQGLSKMQECQIKNMISKTVRDNVMQSLSAQNPLMTGPSGPVGPPGPAGSTYMASGRLVNQLSSYPDKQQNIKNPIKVATRTSGTNPMSSLVYMDEVSPFVSYQSWLYNNKNQIVNRYDNTCLTFSPNQEKLYMSECNDNNNKQKWFWDKSNRLVLLDNSVNKNKNTLKCLAVSEPQVDSLVSSVPDCKGNKCSNVGQKRYLIGKDCDVNMVDSSTIFGFE